jgi:prepilin-type processing-associated H-X9-DG protein
MPRTYSLRFLRCLLFACLLSLVARGAFGQTAYDPAAYAASIAPYLDEQTVAVGHVDLDRVDVAAVMALVREIGPKDEPQFTQQLGQLELAARGAKTALKGAGITELYTVISLTDVPQTTPFLVTPLRPGADPKMAADMLGELTRSEAAEPIGKSIVAGPKTTIERLKSHKPAARPDLAKAFERTQPSAAQFIIAPNEDTRRVVREMLPRLPDEVGGGSGKALADGLQWATLSMAAPPDTSVSLLIQSQDADSATALRSLIVSGFQLLGRHEEIRREMPQFNDLAALLTPRLSGDMLHLRLDNKNGGIGQVVKFLAVPIQQARQAARRTQSSNNLKQIALAMHNYHDTYSKFPPQAIRSKDGKPLLSWRVAILPFLGQLPLYNEFQLDEPWDSEHNKKLIERMPPILLSPGVENLVKPGMTTYLATLSKAPPAVYVPADEEAISPPGAVPPPMPAPQTVFDNPAGTTFSNITDGTSNTILVLEANPNAAVIWTKPDDLVIAEQDPLKDLRGQANDGFNTAFCDGSVRFVTDKIDPKTLWYILLMNEGQPAQAP